MRSHQTGSSELARDLRIFWPAIDHSYPAWPANSQEIGQEQISVSVKFERLNKLIYGGPINMIKLIKPAERYLAFLDADHSALSAWIQARIVDVP